MTIEYTIESQSSNIANLIGAASSAKRGQAKFDQAAAFLTRISARWPVAASTRMSTSVETPWVLPFAIAVTLVLDVPACLTISAWVSGMWMGAGVASLPLQNIYRNPTFIRCQWVKTLLPSACPRFRSLSVVVEEFAR